MSTFLGLYMMIVNRLKGGMPATRPAVEEDNEITTRSYAMIFPTAGHVALDRLTVEGGPRTMAVSVMCVGPTMQAAMNTLDLVDALLIGWVAEPGNPATSRVSRSETNPPLLPSQSVEGDFRYSITPTYMITTDR